MVINVPDTIIKLPKNQVAGSQNFAQNTEQESSPPHASQCRLRTVDAVTVSAAREGRGGAPFSEPYYWRMLCSLCCHVCGVLLQLLTRLYRRVATRKRSLSSTGLRVAGTSVLVG